MKNDGTIPNYERVDIRYRCGHIVRGVDPTKRRWKPWLGVDDDPFDIVAYQPSK